MATGDIVTIVVAAAMFGVIGDRVLTARGARRAAPPPEHRPHTPESGTDLEKEIAAKMAADRMRSM